MTVADSTRSPRKTLVVCGSAHALHDGFTDLLNVLYPLLQAQFALSYAAIGALKAVYSGAMASGQIPSGWLAGRLGGVHVLAFGTALIAVGYGIAGLTGSLYGVIAGLLLAGLGGSTQHPIASTLVAGAYQGLRSRTALGTYNFTGDLGKVVLPALFALVAAALGWRQAMLWYAAAEIVIVVPLAAIYFSSPPEVIHPVAPSAGGSGQARVLGWPPNAVFALMCAAGVLCCMPMAMPQSHLVAFCSDLGIPAAHGAAMMSVLLGCAFLSRQFWGVVADRIGGLRTVLAGSVCQITAMTGFLLTQNEAGLFAVSVAFGLEFSGIIPA